jgi:RNA polymerase sigma-70 factor (ECF subfamily)
VTVTVDKLHSEAADYNKTIDFESLFALHWKRVYGVIFRIVGDPAEAEDLALEAFLKLHRQLEQVTRVEATAISGWLYRVATNLGLNALRARKRRDQYELEAGKLAIENSPAVNPAQAYERIEERQRVRQVLSQMKSRSAKILLLRHAGLSYAEIAEAVQVSPKSIGKLLSRAEKEFETRYRAQEGD